MQYNFPPLKNYDDIPLSTQLSKIREELEELERADTDFQRALEALDLLHAIETYLRILELFIDVDDIKEYVIKKNQDRGYYDDGVGKD